MTPRAIWNKYLRDLERRPLGMGIFGLGVMMTLGFAPFFAWPLSILSLALLYVLVNHARTNGQAAAAGLVWGLGHHISALYWLPRAFYLDADRSVAAAIFGGVPALLAVALYGAAAVALVCALARAAGPRWRPVAFVGFWVAVEVVKSLSPLGFPWLPAGAVWGGSLPLAQAASVAGVHGLSLAVVTLAVLVSGGPAIRWRAAAGILLALYAFGAARLAQPEAPANGPWLRLVQPNIQSEHRWDPRLRWEYLQDALSLAFAPGAATIDAFVMPETAVAFYLQDEDDVRKAVAGRLGSGQELITGTVRRDLEGYSAANPPPDMHLLKFYNSIAVLEADGTISGWYDKKLLVPFGEFIPFRWLLDRLPMPAPIRVVSQSRLDYTAGTLPSRLSTKLGNAVPLICYEGIFPYHVAAAANGAHYLVNITNDNWFTGTIALSQHMTLERLRAIETGLPLVRAANTGITLMTDPYGRVVARLPINQGAHADVQVPLPLPPTPFVRMVGWAASHL